MFSIVERLSTDLGTALLRAAGLTRSAVGRNVSRVSEPGLRRGAAATVHAGEAFKATTVRSWIGEMASDVSARRDYLTQLDAAIGDADHGVNMDRGFAAAIEALGSLEVAGPGRLLRVAGDTLILRVGGAAGPLYGSAFRAAGASLGAARSFDGEALLLAVRSALAAIQQLGAAVEGDKTIVDAWAPAIEALERELRNGGSAAGACEQAARSAAEGARMTVPMQARKGRASYLGPRSVGHQDPGATSTAMLFEALARAVRDLPT
jgi:phosphoenolpyruvate---glycerone phosphotransferase subunit DhaL